MTAPLAISPAPLGATVATATGNATEGGCGSEAVLSLRQATSANAAQSTGAKRTCSKGDRWCISDFRPGLLEEWQDAPGGVFKGGRADALADEPRRERTDQNLAKDEADE